MKLKLPLGKQYVEDNKTLIQSSKPASTIIYTWEPPVYPGFSVFEIIFSLF